MQDPWGVGTGKDATPAKGFFKNALDKTQAKPLPKATVAPRTASRGHRGVTDLQPSETASQVLHSIVKFLGASPTAILHNAAVVGSQTLPPQAGVKPQPASAVNPAGVPLFGPGAVGHGAALGILPFKSLLRKAATDVAQHEAPSLGPRVAAKVARGRTASEAAKHIEEARSFWEAKMPTPALETTAMKPGEITAETGGHAGAVVREAFTTGEQTVAEARKATAELQSVERAKRFAEGEAARAKAGGGTAGQIASLRAQKGELGFVPHLGLAGKPAPVIEEMIHHVDSLPTLREGERLTTIDAIRNWWRIGKPPTVGEEELIAHAFGRDMADAIAKDPTFRDKLAALHLKAGRVGQEAFLLPRALKAAGDFSGLFRQNLLPTITHPIENAKLIPGMVKSTFSESHFQAGQASVLGDPNASIHWAAKVPYTDIGHSGTEGAANLAAREEQFASNLAEKLNLRNLPGLEGLGKLGTGPGDLVRASDRAYLGILNPSRQVISNRLINKAALAGEDLTDPKVVKAIGSATGVLTGRGSLGPWLERHAVTLNALLFSPRFAARSFNLLGFGGKDLVTHGLPGFVPGSYYANLYRASPTAAKEVAASMRNLGIVVASVLYAAHKAGAIVSLDPTNSDFAKIRVGNSRVDIMAGLQQPIRMFAQEILQKETSSQTGKTTHLGGSGFNALGRLDPGWKFISAKASPLPGLGLQQAGLTQKARSQSPSSILGNLFEPLSEQDARNQYQATHSIPAGALALLLSGTGFGIQNYKPKQAKGGGSDPWNAGTGGAPGDPWGVSP